MELVRQYMNNHCWYKLNIRSTTNALRSDWRFPEVSGNYGIWSFLGGQIEKMFTREWLEYMNGVGLEPKQIMLFYKGIGKSIYAGGLVTAHIDILPPGKPPLEFTTGALNFVLMGEGSEMIWYETPKEPREVSFTLANTPYMTWPIKELKEADRVHIGHELMVVRTNVPHTIDMTKAKTSRWCISIRLFQSHKFTWEETIDRLRSLNLIIERQ